MTYFTSDLHFGHGKVMEFDPCFRRFSSVDEMDSHLINLWNSRVTPCDTDTGVLIYVRSNIAKMNYEPIPKGKKVIFIMHVLDSNKNTIENEFKTQLEDILNLKEQK